MFTVWQYAKNAIKYELKKKQLSTRQEKEMQAKKNEYHKNLEKEKTGS